MGASGFGLSDSTDRSRVPIPPTKSKTDTFSEELSAPEGLLLFSFNAFSDLLIAPGTSGQKLFSEERLPVI